MLILCVGYVLQLILVKAEDPNMSNLVDLKPQEVIQMSLRHVNEMLAEFNDNIDKEKKLLSQLEGHGQPPPNGTNTKINESLPKLTGDTQITDIVREWVKHHPETPINETSMCQTTRKPYHPFLIQRQGAEVVNVAPKTVDMLISQDPSLDDPLDVDPQEIPGLPPEWPFNEETSTEPTTTNGTQLPPKLTRKEYMNLYKEATKVGYLYAGIAGIVDMVAEKDDHDLGGLIKPLAKKLEEMEDKGKLNILGEQVIAHARSFWIFLSIISVELIKEYAQEYQVHFLSVSSFPKEYHDIFIGIDSMFEPVDGETLFDVIDEMDRYSVNEHGSNTAENLWEKFINTILEPLKRKKGTLQLRNLIAKANQVLSSQYPDYRRSEMFNMLDHFIEVENEDPNVKRQMSKGTRHIKAKYKKIIRHLIKKHPALLKYFAKHFRKKHDSVFYKKQRSNIKQRHERRKSVDEAMNAITHKAFQATTPKMFPEANLEVPNFRKRVDHTTFMYPNRTQNRYGIVTEGTGGPKRISSNVLKKRFNVYKKRHHGKSNVIKNMSNRLVFSATKTAPNNKVLKKLNGDSSYSDEEKYLKTMLYDAFFHGNDTVTSNWTGRARVHHLGPEDSDTDEEWVFKSNIYKVFQQPII